MRQTQEVEATLPTLMRLTAVPTLVQSHPGQSSYELPPVTLEVDADGLKRGR